MSEEPEELCDACQIAPAEPEHTCPYSEEIHGDSVTLCNCCETCERQCADDI